MAFPFSVYNIAYPAAGFKSQTHVYCNVIVKVACLPSHSLIRRSPEISVTKTQSRPASTQDFPGADLSLDGHSPDFPGEYMRLSSFGRSKGGSD